MQWSVTDLDRLATLVALVLVGRARHAANVLAGAMQLPVATPAAMRAQIRRELVLAPGADPFHRDGLLFEIICWLVARQQAAADAVISEPHTRATQQGVDTLKVSFDAGTRRLIGATIYEYKCTTHPRTKFRDEIIPGFRKLFKGESDPQLAQIALALLERHELTDQEQAIAYDTLVNDRPLTFQAALTVEPDLFPEPNCVALFSNYGDTGAARDARFGDTLPLTDIRSWFSDLAELAWAKINV